ncbi:uncharacterized protein [Nicotiana tomentosiformis]|uniref:uncharacterized protein n=1 Tax=Nicotiana tomentosiformis TaxID=4098 RepID=UPI00388CA6AF
MKNVEANFISEDNLDFMHLDVADYFALLEGETNHVISDESGGDFNGHIGASARGYDDVHGWFSFEDRNERGNSLLDFARAFDLVIANSSFPKREEHLVTFRNSMGKTQIDYLLYRKCDKGMCTDCKVIPSEHLTTLHRLLVMDLEIKRSRRKRAGCRQPKIKWGNLTKDKAQELGEKLLAMRAWMSKGDASSM